MRDTTPSEEPTTDATVVGGPDVPEEGGVPDAPEDMAAPLDDSEEAAEQPAEAQAESDASTEDVTETEADAGAEVEAGDGAQADAADVEDAGESEAAPEPEVAAESEAESEAGADDQVDVEAGAEPEVAAADVETDAVESEADADETEAVETEAVETEDAETEDAGTGDAVEETVVAGTAVDGTAVDGTAVEDTVVRPAVTAPLFADARADDPTPTVAGGGDEMPDVFADLPEPAAERRSRGPKVAALAVAGVVVLAGGAYAVAHQMTNGRVPQGTSVAGVEIGGKQVDEARAQLEAAFAHRAEEPIVVRVTEDAGKGETTSVAPEAAGLSFDHEATLEAAGASSSWSPAAMWSYFTGGDEIDPVVVVDDEKFDAFLDRIDDKHGTKVREGKVSFDGDQIVTRQPRAGEVVDRDVAESSLREAFVGEERSVRLAVEKTLPEIDEADVSKALEEFANPAVSAPVTLKSGDVQVELAPSDFAPALKMVAEDGALAPKLNSDKLASIVQDALAEDGGPKEATVKLVGGKPTVVPDEKGITFDQEQLDGLFLDLVARPEGQRTAEVKSVEATSDFTAEDAKNLNIVEKVSTFETRYPHADYRNINIGRAAELIDGTVLKPGETFSLNETVGERTRENGFTEGFMIADGVFKEDLGGGVSQMATTVFNAMFFAGFEDVEHKPHSFYISRYPVGREATVAWGSVDLRFRNNTDHGVLIEAKVTKSTPGSQGVVRVSMWSTKVWDITTSTSGRYAQTSPKTRTLSGPTCVANSGYGGFNVDVKRHFHKPGQKAIVKTETFRTTYTPSDTVVCN